MNVAVAHEHYPTRGGGEVVADQLADCFDCPIVTGWIKDSDYSRHDPIEILDNTPARVLRRFMGNPLVRDLFYSFAWESVPTLREYDVIIQSGNAPTWYVPEQDQTIVKYNHSPPRNPFDLFWRDESSTAKATDYINPTFIADRLYKKAARQWWKARTDAVDLWVCNSELIAHRTKKYLGVADDRIRVVYPPVDVSQYEPTDGHDGYYVALSRLEPSKRIETIIKAFDGLDAELKVVGAGSYRDELERVAWHVNNVCFEGYVSEDRKRELLQNARASVFAAENEDFGIIPIESFAAGTPVLGVRDGFTEHQIKNGKNGLLFARNETTIRETVKQFEQTDVQWTAQQMHEYSQQFNRERFCREMHDAVAEAQERNQIDVDLSEPMPVIE